MIKIFDNYFLINTSNTSYAFRVTRTGHLEHLYYGARISAECKADLQPLKELRGFAPGNTCSYKDYEGNIKNPYFTLEDIRLELSSYGKGDIREPFVEIIHRDGSNSSDFLFEEARVQSAKPSYKTMPTSYYKNTLQQDVSDDSNDDVLIVVCKDHLNNLVLETVYSVFYETDVITRMTKLINTSSDDIKIKRLMSTQLDLDGTGYVFHSFNGAWTREMNHHQMKVTGAKAVNSSYTGTSSSRANPFVMISTDATNEDAGDVYAVNLVYSGNHLEVLEAFGYDKTRFVAGINPQGFEYLVRPGEEFEAPEAVMTFSNNGFNKMSQNMHDFVNNHIVRGKYKNTVRPVVLNSWEACYFDINEEKLVELATKAKDVGIETFVMDDGWFGARNDDSCSLGDWYVNQDKLPGGLESLVRKINDLGLGFGIWVEPEMVNADSDLYRQHPEYAVKIPGKSHCEGRGQMILDLTRKEVRDYIVDSMRKVFSSANISYVKWDMNRIFTDVYSASLPANQQGEVLHRYVCGLYEILETLTKEFPDILFEGCSSGGNRFDLGVLSYYPQIWASDDTDAYQRVNIQNGYSYGYPQSTYTAHVSDVPNHQTRRFSPMETRFNVACFGNLGYECNLNHMSEEDNAAIKKQIAYYKEHREDMLYGSFWRGSSIASGDNKTNWTIVSKNKEKAFNMCMQDRMSPNLSMNKTYVKGLDPMRKYDVTMVNFVACEQTSSKEKVCTAYGDALLGSGMFIKPGFVGTGDNCNVMDYQDLGSRLFEFIDVNS